MNRDAGEELLGVARIAGRTLRACWVQVPGRPLRALRVSVEVAGRSWFLDLRQDEIEPLERLLELARRPRDDG